LHLRDVAGLFRVETGGADLDGVEPVVREIFAGLQVDRFQRFRREALYRVAEDRGDGCGHAASSGTPMKITTVIPAGAQRRAGTERLRSADLASGFRVCGAARLRPE